MKVIIYFLFIFCVWKNIAKATSTAFDQNTIIKFSHKGQSLNESFVSNSNLNSILISGTINYLGKKMFRTGYLYPLGLVPSNIFNLSPLAYQENQTDKEVITLFKGCSDNLFLSKNSMIIGNHLGLKSCKKYVKKNNLNEINNLVKKYY